MKVRHVVLPAHDRDNMTDLIRKVVMDTVVQFNREAADFPERLVEIPAHIPIHSLDATVEKISVTYDAANHRRLWRAYWSFNRSRSWRCSTWWESDGELIAS